jgi:gamma-glutamylcyclotransferase (GGCT)/AIG2-like uncharacterized protein YtfP
MVKNKGKQANFRYMDRAQKHNKDGYGLAWYEDNRVKTYKTFDYKAFKGVLSALKHYDVVVHLRNTTKGDDSYDNLHPFDIPSGVMFHNGTMRDLGSGDMSDSRELAGLLNECDYKYIEDIEPLIRPYIDDNINRLVFFEDTGEITIMNKFLGIEEDGIWYSNDYHSKDDSWSRYPSNRILHKVQKIDVAEEPIKVFVYGTLKKGYSNEMFLRGAKFLGKATTVNKWLMVGKGASYPFVLGRHEKKGKQIKGEIYSVDRNTLINLDMLEGVPTLYKRAKITCSYVSNNRSMIDSNVIMYVKSTCNLNNYKDEEFLSEWKG